MITIQQEMVADFLEELKELVYNHHDEVEDNEWKLDPDYEAYVALNEEGSIIYHTVRDDGKLVGYSGDFVTINLHYRGKLCSHNDLIYMLPDYRHLQITDLLVHEVEASLKALGVEMHTISMKTGTPGTRLMGSNGYINNEINWTKRLRQWQ